MKRDKLNEYDVTKDMISRIRLMNTKQQKKKFINEEKENEDAIAITNDPKFGQNVLRNQIASYKQAVHGGEKFSE